MEAFKAMWLNIAERRYANVSGYIKDGIRKDAVQEASARLIQRITTLRNPQKLEAFARAIFVNAALDILRDEHKVNDGRVYPDRDVADNPQWWVKLVDDVMTDPQTPTPEEERWAEERLRRVQDLVRCMSQQQRKVLTAKFLEDLSDREGAKRIGLGPDRYRHIVMEVRKLLRKPTADF